MTTDVSKVLEAISYAAREHRGQVRKDGKTPYAAHPCRVVSILLYVFRVDDLDLLAAAALHDTIEDTPVDRDDLAKNFGNQVADWVAALTKDMRLPEAERETKFLERLVAAGPEVMVIKLADAYDNLLDSEHLSAKKRRKTVNKAREHFAAFRDKLGSRWDVVLREFENLLRRYDD